MDLQAQRKNIAGAAPEHILAIAFTLSLLLLAIMAAASYYNISSLVTSMDWVQHSHQVLVELEKVKVLLAEAEAAQRGFDVSGDKDFLAPYNENVPEIKRLLASLRALTSDNPMQQKRMDQLESAVQQKLAIIQSNIRMRETQGAEAAIQAIASQKGLAAMNEVRQRSRRAEPGGSTAAGISVAPAK